MDVPFNAGSTSHFCILHYYFVMTTKPSIKQYKFIPAKRVKINFLTYKSQNDQISSFLFKEGYFIQCTGIEKGFEKKKAQIKDKE